MIVAPWWQWTDPEAQAPGKPVDPRPLDGRLSQPVFQKYDSPGLAERRARGRLKRVNQVVVHELQAMLRVSEELVDQAG